jgi:DNA polymerase I-like protein with 3'-5' exonuclease and polymerase domains
VSAALQICERLCDLQEGRTKVAHDIEGYATSGVSVCSFAWSATEALSVPLRHLDWTPLWSDEEEAAILIALKGLLEDPLVPKVGQNWTYELFVWRWKYGIHVRGIADDTMLKFHVLYAELDKALDVIASLYSREPYWKDMGDTTDDEQLARYNALDSMVTFEVNEALERDMTDAHQAYYRHQLALLDPCHEMSFAGMPYDAAARDAMVARIQQEVFAAQGKLDQLAGIAHPTFEDVKQGVAMKVKWGQCATWDDLLLCAKPSMRAPL